MLVGPSVSIPWPKHLQRKSPRMLETLCGTLFFAVLYSKVTDFIVFHSSQSNLGLLGHSAFF